MIAMAHIDTLPRIEPFLSRLSDLLGGLFHWPEFSPLEDAEERADLWDMIERNPEAFTSNSSIQDLMSLYPRH
jgi:hypothetical protein